MCKTYKYMCNNKCKTYKYTYLGYIWFVKYEYAYFKKKCVLITNKFVFS